MESRKSRTVITVQDRNTYDFPNGTPVINNFDKLKSSQARELSSIFKKNKLDKVLIIDPSLISLLNCMLPMAELRGLNVKCIYTIDDYDVCYDNTHYVYLVRPITETIKTLLNNVDNYYDDYMDTTTLSNLHEVYFVPHVVQCYHDLLARTNVFHNIFACYFCVTPLSNTLLSLEYPSSLEDMSLDVCAGSIVVSKDVILKLELLYGNIPQIQGYNTTNSAKLLRELQYQRSESYYGRVKNVGPFSRLTVFDRTLDLLTLCIMPATFEGLVEEFIGSKNGVILFDGNKISINDDLYAKIKDCHMSRIKHIIDEELSSVTEKEADARNKLNILKQRNRYDTDLVRCITELNNHKKILSKYMDIAKFLINEYNSADFQDYLQCEHNTLQKIEPEATRTFLDNQIAASKNIYRVLRLLCLYSQVYGVSLYNNYFIKIVTTYGVNYAKTMIRLKDMGFFDNEIEKGREYIDYEANFSSVGESTAYGGYIPMSVSMICDLTRELPETKGVDMVYFMGGCTSSELTALKVNMTNAVVVTTEILTFRGIVG